MLRFATITNMAPISIPYIHLLLAMTELAGLFLVVIFIFRYKHQLVLNSWLFSKKSCMLSRCAGPSEGLKIRGCQW